jgi:hypothetical protein
MEMALLKHQDGIPGGWYIFHNGTSENGSSENLFHGVYLSTMLQVLHPASKRRNVTLIHGYSLPYNCENNELR